MHAHYRIDFELLEMIFVDVNIFQYFSLDANKEANLLQQRELLMPESGLINFKNFLTVSKTWLWRMTKKGILQAMVHWLPAKWFIPVSDQPRDTVKKDVYEK